MWIGKRGGGGGGKRMPLGQGVSLSATVACGHDWSACLGTAFPSPGASSSTWASARLSRLSDSQPAVFTRFGNCFPPPPHPSANTSYPPPRESTRPTGAWVNACRPRALTRRAVPTLIAVRNIRASPSRYTPYALRIHTVDNIVIYGVYTESIRRVSGGTMDETGTSVTLSSPRMSSPKPDPARPPRTARTSVRSSRWGEADH